MSVEEIRKNHRKKHNHNSDQPRCKTCNQFISRDKTGGLCRYKCSRCNEWKTEFVGPKAKV